MSDFLTSLVGRSLPSADPMAAGRLRPRLPYLFEATVDHATVWAGERQPGRDEAEVSNSAPNPMASRSRRLTRDVAQGTGEGSFHPQRVDLASLNPSANRPMLNTIVPPEAQTTARVPARIANQISSGMTETLHPTKVSMERDQGPDPAIKVTTLRASTRRESTRDDVRSIIPRLAPTPPAPTTPRGEPPGLSEAGNPPGLERHPDSPSPPPSIRITIGRIDVRAVSPSPPSARPSMSPRPQLTLDDYLRQRNEGRR